MKPTSIIGKGKSSIKHLGLAVAAGASLVAGSASAITVYWDGGNGDWDTTTSNWLDGASSPTVFTDGDDAIFDLAGSSVTVVGTVAPLTTTVDASSGDYTIRDGVIGGTGTLTKTGSARLTLSGANTFTGKTIVQAGTLRLGIPDQTGIGFTNAGVAGPLGAPTGADATIELHNDVTLEARNTIPRVDQTTDRPLDLAGTGPGTVTILTNDNDTQFTFGAVTATGTGAKTLALGIGAFGNGDRASMIFAEGISDSSDASPTSLEVDYGPGGVADRFFCLAGDSTFTGPITLVAHNGPGYFTVGGLRTGQANSGAPAAYQNIPGTGSLGGGNYPGDISLGAKTIFNYLSSASQTLSGVIFGEGTVIVDGGGTVTLEGLNTYSSNTTVESGSTLVLADNGGMTFAVTDSTSTKVTGDGTATFAGDFTIDTSLVTTATGSWTLVDVAAPTFSGTFTVAGAGWSETSDVWTKVDGTRTWTFTEADGMLTLGSQAVFTSFSYAGSAGTIDNDLLTITLVVPMGTDFATVAPDFTLSSGTCDRTSGAVPSPNTFADANPLTYTVTDGGTVSAYAVTVVEATGIINVSAEKSGQESDLALLDGPGGGLGETWNQVTTNTGSAFLDSSGAVTSVGFTVNSDGLDFWNSGALQMLHSGLRNFGKGSTKQLEINGLTPDDVYDVWIASTQGNSETGKGVWTSLNPSGSGPQSVDSSSGPNITTWEQGHNYVVLESVVVDIDGKIVLEGVAAAGFRLPVNGFQLAPVGAARITAFGIPGSDGVIDQGAKTIALEVPFGTDLATLAPEFTLSSGTCDQTSGAVPNPNFGASNPVDYVVTDTTTDPVTRNTYRVTVTEGPQVGTLVIELGSYPPATEIEGGEFIGSGPTNLPLPSLPVGSILRKILVETRLEATDNGGVGGDGNWANEFAVLLDPTPGTPGDDFSVGITSGPDRFGELLQLNWAAEQGEGGPGTDLIDTKTDADFGTIDLATTGLFLGNAYVDASFTPGEGGTWSGTITLTYDLVGGGADYDTWAAGFLPDDVSNPAGDFDGDGLTNDEERVFGLDPTDPSSVDPFSVPLDASARTFSYTRRDPTLSGLTYTIWTSPDAQSWTEDTTASAGQVPGTVVDEVQSVDVTLTAPLGNKLFVQVRAN